VTAAGLLLALHTAPVARQSCGSETLVRLGSSTGFAASWNAAISGNGRYVAFESSASEFDGDSITDIFVYDRAVCTLELISVNSAETKGNLESQRPSISDDGRFVAFISHASNLVAADTNGFFRDAFVRDRLLGVTALISVSSTEVQPANDSAVSIRISGNGQVAVFVSEATTLVAGDTNNEADVFARDLIAGTTERVSVSSAGSQGDSPYSTGVWDPVLSADGRFVAFASSMNTLVPDDFNDSEDIFVRDRVMNLTVRASLRPDGTEAEFGGFASPALTADGQFVYFSSYDNLVPGNTSCDGLFIRDLVLSTTSCVTLDPADVIDYQSAERPAVSSDGRYVTFMSYEHYYVPGDTNFDADVFVHDQVTGVTRRVNVSALGLQAQYGSYTYPGISGDGQIVVFDSYAGNLVPGDFNEDTDVFVAAWARLPSPPEANLTSNGSFASGLQFWQPYATPAPTYIVTDTSAGELQFYRVEPPPGTSNQAVVFQNTGAALLPYAPVEARFRLGNSSTVRKRISVLVHDADFSDLSVCTFWLEASAPMRPYVMRTHTTRFWTNATISFYAATSGSDGGFYRVDDVLLFSQPINDDDVTDCLDPTAPVAPGGAPGPTLFTNGDFSAGLAPWATFGQITWQITNGVFEFVRPPGTPAGVVLQTTGQSLSQHDILTVTFYLGNSSAARKRVTVLLHDSDFTDLSACTFWLSPNLPLSPYLMRTFATKPWTNATFSLYPGTVGPDEWIRFTDAVLQLTPGTTPLGTECREPGADSLMVVARQR
jgi:Tol biopolymer transport system component